MLLFTVKRREKRHIVISLALRWIFANFVCIWLQQENCISIKSYINKAVRRCGLVLCWHCFVFFPDVRFTESHWKQFSAQLLFNVICSTSLWLFEKKSLAFITCCTIIYFTTRYTIFVYYAPHYPLNQIKLTKLHCLLTNYCPISALVCCQTAFPHSGK